MCNAPKDECLISHWLTWKGGGRDGRTVTLTTSKISRITIFSYSWCSAVTDMIARNPLLTFFVLLLLLFLLKGFQYTMASMAVLLGGCLFITSVMANNKTHHNEERSQRGIALLGNAYRSFHSGNYPSCLIACMDDSNCMSFNFWWNSSKCDLNNKTKHTAELKFLAQDVPATYMGLMREPGETHICGIHFFFFSLGFFCGYKATQRENSPNSLSLFS